jgi:probable F420-dependent oxidoreductase
MTEAVSLKPELGRFGVWLPTRSITPELAAKIEALGYGAIWIGGSPDAELAWVEPALAQTTSLQLATGIVNVWSAPAPAVAESFHRIEGAHPGRFLLGVGIGHPEHTDEYIKPFNALVGYLDELDAAMVPTSRRVLAALGPRVLKLSAERSAGAHPYLTTPQHTAKARELVGNSVFLAPEHKVVLTTDADEARKVGRETADHYLGLSNYVNNWRRLGFSEDDVRKPGSDRLIDSVVAYGTPDAIAQRLNEHLEAGADHVAIQVLGGWREETLLPALTELAGPLGVTPPS